MLISSRYHPKLYLSQILLCILADVLCENLILGSFSSYRSEMLSLSLFGIYMLLQIIFAPIQAAFSDFHCRRKSLIYSLVFGIASLGILFLFNLLPNKTTFNSVVVFLLVAAVNGIAGNTTPIACAGIGDTKTKQVRKSFGLASSPFALSYVILAFMNSYLKFSYSIFSVFCFYIIIIALVSKFFFDIRDKNPSNKKEKLSFIESYRRRIEHLKLEKEKIKIILANKQSRGPFLAFFFWEISLYSILFALVDLKVASQSIAFGTMGGYVVGLITLFLLGRLSNQFFINLGYWVSSLSLVPYFLIGYFVSDKVLLAAVCYFFHGIGNAFLCPTFFASIVNKKNIDNLGVSFGLMDSFDSSALFLSALGVWLLVRFFDQDMLGIISFSFITFNLSWFFYKTFHNGGKSKKEIYDSIESTH